jgi:hypothetical protein
MYADNDTDIQQVQHRAPPPCLTSQQITWIPAWCANGNVLKVC